ncbi:hemicentin-1-like [Neocloeon triangulifer]|uniref:hemicentin-1-like n=1 Tax=Neocloeon triangulifer TaxID=2078957 RepID=UPI00286EB7C8|nr:hemicentin-1-like [Neocloeon triangulifer]
MAGAHAMLWLLLLVAGGAALATPDDALDFQKNLPAPEVIWAVQGQDAELPCDITAPILGDKVNMVLWFKDSTGIPLYSVDARGGTLESGPHWAMSSAFGLRTFFMSGTNGAGKLRIKKVEAEDQGVYRCRVDFLNSRTKNFRVNLTIVVPPDTPQIYNAQGEEVVSEAGPFLEGYDLYLSCHVTGGQPKSSVSWWMGNQLLDATHDAESTNSNVSINQLFLPSVGRSLWGQRMACHARNSNMTSSVVKEVALLIYLKPKKVHIKVSRGATFSAGRMHQLECESWGSVPAPRMTWLVDGELLRLADTVITHGLNSSTSALVLQPTLQDHGKELTCRAENPRFPGGFVEDRIRMNIAYVPTAYAKLGVNIDPHNIKEGDNVYFVCDVTANPPVNNISWLHNENPLWQDAEKGVIMGDKRLLLKSVSRSAAGAYQCVASNSEGSSRSEPAHLKVLFAPGCKGVGQLQMGALRHETIGVRCEVEADPPMVRFSWTYNRSRDVLHVPGARVHSSGLTSTLDYTPVSDVDFGTLACWASNSIGRQKVPCLFHIVPAKTPRPPEQCTITNSSSAPSGLEVVCIAGEDGGLPQYFVLEVSEARNNPLDRRRDDSDPDSEDSDEQVVSVGAAVQADGPAGLTPISRVVSPEPKFFLENLDPGRKYDLSVYAANARGKSEVVLLPKVRVFASEEHRLASTGNTVVDEVAQPAALVLGALVAVASLALCCLFAAVATVLCRQRRSSRPRAAVKPPAPEEEKPSVELSVISAPATVRPHRHLPTQRRSQVEAEMCQQHEALLAKEAAVGPVHPPPPQEVCGTWRRSKGELPRIVEPDLIVSKAEVVLHLQNSGLASKTIPAEMCIEFLSNSEQITQI